MGSFIKIVIFNIDDLQICEVLEIIDIVAYITV